MKRILLTLVLIVFAASVCSAQNSVYFPHIANGALFGHSYKTTIFLLNPGAAGSPAVTATILFFKEVSQLDGQGTPFDLTFTADNGVVFSGNSIAITLGPGASRKLSSTGTGAFGTGFGVVLSNSPIAGTATFTDLDGTGKVVSEAAVPAAVAVPKQAIFVDTVGGYNVGIAYANPDGFPADLTLRLLNADGVQVATTTQLLGPGNHKAAFPHELFTAVPASTFNQFTGTMTISSATPLAALALRYDPSFSIFTTISPIQVASVLNPALRLLARLTPIARLVSVFGIGLG